MESSFGVVIATFPCAGSKRVLRELARVYVDTLTVTARARAGTEPQAPPPASAAITGNTER